MRRRPICAIVLTSGALIALAWSTPLRGQSGFPHGIASGEVTPHSALLWARVDREGWLTVEVSTDPAFRRRRLERAALASAENDFTARVVVAPLTPGRTYFYRWSDGSVLSEIGSFQTAPPPGRKADVRFAYSGDSDGTRVAGLPFFNNFEVFDAARLERLDFFVYLGDTIYADSSLRPGPAVTLDEFRQTYKVNREYLALRGLLRATSTYVVWDDHEVQNDFDGETIDRTLYANGRRAFLEYLPIADSDIPVGSHCAGAPFFRRFHWGKDIDVIVLDERSCRSPDVQTACSFAPGIPDLAPTLPPQVRVLFGLPPSPPPGCLAALFDPSRTMLGAEQKELLKEALLRSRAAFKFVINELPIQQFYALPYDRWEGYGAERNEILSFIRENEIENVIFLTTDTHANLINEVFIDRFLDPQPVAEEFVTGPVATFTLQQSILALFGEQGLSAFHGILSIVDVDCRHLDAFSYGLVEVDAGAGMATIMLKSDTGATLRDQLDPSRSCFKTVGP